jgi:hypothetical protein
LRSGWPTTLFPPSSKRWDGRTSSWTPRMRPWQRTQREAEAFEWIQPVLFDPEQAGGEITP